uniref:Uncharacterized protein n=1 Tax=Fagus sylvatica TaxID=28930 RepID=A0A2N9IIZ2_FAGSY
MDELTKSTTAAAASPALSRFDGELAKSTTAILAFFLAALPLLAALSLLTALDGPWPPDPSHGQAHPLSAEPVMLELPVQPSQFGTLAAID